MRVVGLSLLMLFTPMTAKAAECDCTTYPFRPNPPCYGQCVERLSAKPGGRFSNVRNIDPGVSVGIRVLSEGDRSSIDFKGISGKADLERAALKSLLLREGRESEK